MKFTVMFKSPGVVDDAIDEVVDEEMTNEFPDPRLEDWELERLCDPIREQLRCVVSKYVKHGESIAVEFDTRTGTARVLEA